MKNTILAFLGLVVWAIIGIIIFKYRHPVPPVPFCDIVSTPVSLIGGFITFWYFMRKEFDVEG